MRCGLVEWTEDQREAIIGNCMDICANVDGFRQVVLLTVSMDGTMNIVRKRRDDATAMELLGALELIKTDELRTQMDGWYSNPRPMTGDGGGED